MNRIAIARRQSRVIAPVAMGLFLSLLFTLSQAQERPVDEVLAVVEKKVITTRDMDFYVFEARLLNPDFIHIPTRELRRQFLSEAIDEYLLAGWAEFQLKQIPEEAIEARLRAAMERYEKLAGGRTPFRAMLEDSAIEEREFRLWAHEQAKRSFAIREVLRTYADLAGASPTDGELQDASRIRLAHILIVPKGRGEKPEAQALERALQVRRDIEAGISFMEAARLHSDDSLTMMDGGELGWFGQNELASELWTTAVATKRGETSSPVRTRAGFHLVYVMDYETPGQQEYYLKMREEERHQVLKLRSENDIRLREGYGLTPLAPVGSEEGTFWDQLETSLDDGAEE